VQRHDLAMPYEFALVRLELEVVEFVDEPGLGGHDNKTTKSQSQEEMRIRNISHTSGA
jgi:hypothetical protein